MSSTEPEKPMASLFSVEAVQGAQGNGIASPQNESFGSNPGVGVVPSSTPPIAQEQQAEGGGGMLSILGAGAEVVTPPPAGAVNAGSLSTSSLQGSSISSLTGSLSSPAPGSAKAGSQANLIVNYIPIEINEEDFEKLFAQYGTVESAKIVTERGTGASKGYGFIKYSDPSAAQEAMKRLDGYAIYNKRLKVGLAARQQSASSENAAGARIVLGGGSNAGSSAASHNNSISSLSGSFSGGMPPAGGMIPVSAPSMMAAPPMVSGTNPGTPQQAPMGSVIYGSPIGPGGAPSPAHSPASSVSLHATPGSNALPMPANPTAAGPAAVALPPSQTLVTQMQPPQYPGVAGMSGAVLPPTMAPAPQAPQLLGSPFSPQQPYQQYPGVGMMSSNNGQPQQQPQVIIPQHQYMAPQGFVQQQQQQPQVAYPAGGIPMQGMPQQQPVFMTNTMPMPPQ